jgi:hypothetical protein
LLVVWKEKWLTGRYQHSTASEEGELFHGRYKVTRALGVKPESPQWWLDPPSSSISPIVLLPSPSSPAIHDRRDSDSDSASHPPVSDDQVASGPPSRGDTGSFSAESEPTFPTSNPYNVSPFPRSHLRSSSEPYNLNVDHTRRSEDQTSSLPSHEGGRYLEGGDSSLGQESFYRGTLLQGVQSGVQLPMANYRSEPMVPNQLGGYGDVVYNSSRGNLNSSTHFEGTFTTTNPTAANYRDLYLHRQFYHAPDWRGPSGDGMVSSQPMWRLGSSADDEVPQAQGEAFDHFMQQFPYVSDRPGPDHTFHDVGQSHLLPLFVPTLNDLPLLSGSSNTAAKCAPIDPFAFGDLRSAAQNLSHATTSGLGGFGPPFEQDIPPPFLLVRA